MMRVHLLGLWGSNVCSPMKITASCRMLYLTLLASKITRLKTGVQARLIYTVVCCV